MFSTAMLKQRFYNNSNYEHIKMHVIHDELQKTSLRSAKLRIFIIQTVKFDHTLGNRNIMILLLQ